MSDDIIQQSLLLRLCRRLYNLKYIGVENIPSQGACILAFNHSGRYLDLISLKIVSILRPDTIAFGAVGLPPTGVTGWLMRRFKPIEDGSEPGRLSAFKARGSSAGELLKALNLLRAGRLIAIAPEGEVPWDGQLIYPLAPGAAWMALRARVPIIPFVVIGGYDVLPRWRDYPRLSGQITVRVGQPLDLVHLPMERVDDQAISSANQLLYETMTALISQGHA